MMSGECAVTISYNLRKTFFLFPRFIIDNHCIPHQVQNIYYFSYKSVHTFTASITGSLIWEELEGDWQSSKECVRLSRSNCRQMKIVYQLSAERSFISKK